jgi:hypothetical protein
MEAAQVNLRNSIEVNGLKIEIKVKTVKDKNKFVL